MDGDRGQMNPATTSLEDGPMADTADDGRYVFVPDPFPFKQPYGFAYDPINDGYFVTSFPRPGRPWYPNPTNPRPPKPPRNPPYIPKPRPGPKHNEDQATYLDTDYKTPTSMAACARKISLLASTCTELSETSGQMGRSLLDGDTTQEEYGRTGICLALV